MIFCDFWNAEISQEIYLLVPELSGKTWKLVILYKQHSKDMFE
jgi:hypothetical protein